MLNQVYVKPSLMNYFMTINLDLDRTYNSSRYLYLLGPYKMVGAAFLGDQQ